MTRRHRRMGLRLCLKETFSETEDGPIVRGETNKPSDGNSILINPYRQKFKWRDVYEEAYPTGALALR